MYALSQRLGRLYVSLIGFCFFIASYCYSSTLAMDASSSSSKLKNKDAIQESKTIDKKTSPDPSSIAKKDSKTEQETPTSLKEEKPNTKDEKKQKKEAREKKQVEWIERTLEFGIQQDRMEAISAIPKIHNVEERNRLCQKLRDTLKEEIDTEIKTKAISILGELKYKDALPEILASIDDENQDVKIAAVYAIKRIGDDSAKDKLSEELKKQDLKKQSNYSEALIHTLGEFKAIELKDFAIDAIKKDTTEKNIRQNLIIFLGQIDAKDSKDFLLSIAKDDSEEVISRAYAVNALARMKITDSASDIDAIVKEIDSYPFKKRQRYYKLYIYSIAALARMGYEKVLPRLENAARSNNEQVRLQAIKLLKEIKGKRTIDILKYRAKYDPSTKVQRAAKEALEELGFPFEEESEKEEIISKEIKRKSEKLQKSTSTKKDEEVETEENKESD